MFSGSLSLKMRNCLLCLHHQEGQNKLSCFNAFRYLPKYYSYDSLGNYNALLSLFNIRAEKVSTSYNGQTKQGLVYFALNQIGEKVSDPFKASLFGKGASYEELGKHFIKTK